MAEPEQTEIAMAQRFERAQAQHRRERVAVRLGRFSCASLGIIGLFLACG